MITTLKSVKKLKIMKIILRSVVTILCAIFLLPFTVDAKNLYVNNSGSPACSDSTTYANNSAVNPWCTLLRAVRGNADGNRNTGAVPAQAAQAGDTVYVTAGTYNYTGPAYNAVASFGWLGVFYDPVNSGTSGAWITFQAVGAVNLTGNATGRAAVIGSNTGNYIKWIGFTINEASSSQWMSGFTAITQSNVWFEGNTIIGMYRAVGDNHAGIMVHGPRASDCTGVISGITIRNNSISGFVGNSGRNDAGITLYCADNIVIENNEISNNGTGIYSKSSYTPSALTPAVTIRKNIIRNNSADGLGLQSWSNWHIYQNLILGNQFGITMFNYQYYVGGAQPRNYRVANNTLYGNQVNFRLEGSCNLATNMVYRNNIAYNASANSIWGEQSGCTTNITKSNYDFNYNMYGQGSNFGDLFFLRFPLSTWQSATYDYQDPNSTSGTNPLFVNASGGNFRLQAGSPAINAGRDILDLNNNGSTTDTINLGAYITGNEIIGRISNSVVTAPPASVR